MSVEDKLQRLFEFALSIRHDPDFNRLVFPPAVLAKLAEAGVAVAPKEYSAASAVERCFTMSSTEKYTSPEIQVIDQTKMDITFPAIPPAPVLELEEATPPEPVEASTTDVFTVVDESKTQTKEEAKEKED